MSSDGSKSRSSRRTLDRAQSAPPNLDVEESDEEKEPEPRAHPLPEMPTLDIPSTPHTDAELTPGSTPSSTSGSAHASTPHGSQITEDIPDTPNATAQLSPQRLPRKKKKHRKAGSKSRSSSKKSKKKRPVPQRVHTDPPPSSSNEGRADPRAPLESPSVGNRTQENPSAGRAPRPKINVSERSRTQDFSASGDESTNSDPEGTSGRGRSRRRKISFSSGPPVVKYRREFLSSPPASPRTPTVLITNSDDDSDDKRNSDSPLERQHSMPVRLDGARIRSASSQPIYKAKKSALRRRNRSGELRSRKYVTLLTHEREFVDIVARGGFVTKFSKRGFEQKTWLQVSEDHETLCYGPSPTSIKHRLSLLDLLGMFPGCDFGRLKDAKDPHPWLCFTLSFVHKDIAVKCKDEQQFMSFYMGIQSVGVLTSYHFTRGQLHWWRIKKKLHHSAHKNGVSEYDAWTELISKVGTQQKSQLENILHNNDNNLEVYNFARAMRYVNAIRNTRKQLEKRMDKFRCRKEEKDCHDPHCIKHTNKLFSGDPENSEPHFNLTDDELNGASE